MTCLGALPEKKGSLCLGASVMRVMLVCLTLLMLATPSISQTSDGDKAAPPVRIHVFWAKGCVHCKKALAYLGRLESSRPQIRIVRHEVTEEKQSHQDFVDTAKRFGVHNPGVPFIVIGQQAYVGYRDDASTGQILKAAALQCLQTHCPDGLLPGAERDVHTSRPTSPPASVSTEAPMKSLRLPWVGEIELRSLSLPLLTILLAAADGFNPCAMWVLIFLLGLLVGVENRLRRFVLGSTFIFSSAIVYYLIMTAWLNTLLLLGMIVWIRMAIGLVSLCVGGWSVREYFRNPENICTVTAAPARRKVLEKLKAFALSPSLILAFAGIILLAFAVNVVELLCSAGIPATYTQILALQDLQAWQYYAYIGLYVLVFMLDDLLIFLGAMLAIEITGLGARYARWANLFGGLLLIGLGIVIIAKPEWLA